MTATALSPASDATSHHQDVLNALVDLGHRLVNLAVAKAEADTLPIEKAASIYDRVTRSIRRSMWLVRKLAEPVTTVDRVAARKQIIRTVEDTIQRHTEDEEAEALHQELRERLDTLDLEDEIHGRKLDDIIDDIIRDLGLVPVPGHHPWKRRTPADVATLCAHAAQPITKPPQPHPHHGPVGCNSS